MTTAPAVTGKKKLPKYVRQRSWGAYQYKRDVPKHLRVKAGKATVYHALGTTFMEMVKNLPTIDQQVVTYFASLEAENSRTRTLAIVKSHFGEQAAQQLDAGQLNTNLVAGLWDLAGRLEDDVEPDVYSNLLGASVPVEIITLQTAFDLYGAYKDADQDKKLKNALSKVQADLKASIGAVKLKEVALADLRREDALLYRDYLLARISPNSVSRYINVVRAVVNHAIQERGIVAINPFHNLKVKGAGQSAKDRLPLSAEEAEGGLVTMGSQEDHQAIYLTLWDTGARLNEVTGIVVDDVDLQNRSLSIRPNSIRALKTASSERLIPLSSRAVKALTNLCFGKEGDDPVFSRYGRPNGNTAASAAMMKKLRKQITDPKKSLHSLRHKKKDDLRNVGCPEEISKVILGHSSQEAATRYGAGYRLEVLREWMEKSYQ
ncbi:tyrosine-type recombinase/integrase [Falsihalocynthiibacter sp. S25ZX9]|uniref:tyrosine-type recombinase/integrase n=1 Tax=Falsihalocynthiibacter sp. S25ZX9 TaxID=3240870 RepID=UPI00350EA9CE